MSPRALSEPGLPATPPQASASPPPRHVLRRGPGRETALVERAPGAARIEKRYGPPGDRAASAAREHANLRALAALGLLVPGALGLWREGRAGVVAMDFVRHGETLRELLARAGPAERRRRAAELLELVTRFHGAGWFHRDLYLQHVLVRAGDARLVLIDLGRARRRRRARSRWLVKDLAALLHSTPAAVPAAERLRFLAGWLDRRGVRGRRARRRWLRRVLAKERRMARHRPRAGESFPIPERWRG